MLNVMCYVHYLLEKQINKQELVVIIIITIFIHNSERLVILAQ